MRRPHADVVRIRRNRRPHRSPIWMQIRRAAAARRRLQGGAQRAPRRAPLLLRRGDPARLLRDVHARALARQLTLKLGEAAEESLVRVDDRAATGGEGEGLLAGRRRASRAGGEAERRRGREARASGVEGEGRGEGRGRRWAAASERGVLRSRIRKARTSEAERETPREQWTKTAPPRASASAMKSRA